jgi:hypothetical protein
MTYKKKQIEMQFYHQSAFEIFGIFQAAPEKKSKDI